MQIEEVITEAVLAVYSVPELAEHVYLKGGAALRLLDELNTRLSIDADFSLDHPLKNPGEFFGTIQQSLIQRFEPYQFDILDFRFRRKPEKAHPDKPDWWGGWICEFKLCPVSFRKEPLETRRRNALVPEGTKKSTIPLDISDHEYCGKGRRKNVGGVEIHGYTRELLVLEKLRAICQQHPDYPYNKDKNRARDFYDILQLTQNADEAFLKNCHEEIEKVFAAKEVPLLILNALWDEDFTDTFARGFDQVRETVQGTPYPFDTYLEHARFLVMDILPDLHTED
jgi:hypothetical protein